MTANQKMIAVLLVLFVNSLQITSARDPPITGDFNSLAPKREEMAKEYIKKLVPGLLQATLRLRHCEFHCEYQTSTGKMQGWFALPEGFPCAFGSTCDYGGNCKCSACP
uniref:Putative peptide 9.1 kDa n=1 Tax=Ixodes pacificus TaxID=29930 RepID=Q6B889_IXOPA|nr:putative peptide 9.1 kDa [Ixodes pacificus]